jgi:hypothetical protein
VRAELTIRLGIGNAPTTLDYTPETFKTLSRIKSSDHRSANRRDEMKYLKMLGIAAAAAMVFTAFAASTSSATTLEVGGVTQNSAVTLEMSLATGTSTTLSSTDGSIANTCTTSAMHGTTSTFTGSVVTAPLKTLTFANCTRPVTVHKAGTIEVSQIANSTNGTAYWDDAEVTFSTPFGTLNCKPSPTTHIGTITGSAVIGKGIMHGSGVLNCGFLLPSATWKGTYTVTSPSALGVSA